MSQDYVGYDAWMASLSLRTRNVLRCAGFSTQEAVRKAYMFDDGQSLLRVPNLGKVSLREIAEKIEDQPKVSTSSSVIAEAIVLLVNSGYLVTKEKP